jgi:hypothetical protein
MTSVHNTEMQSKSLDFALVHMLARASPVPTGVRIASHYLSTKRIFD